MCYLDVAATGPQLGKNVSKYIFYKHSVSILTLSVFSLLAVAQADDLRPEVELDYQGSDCIWIRTIRDYTALDDENLLIWASGRRPYFVRLFSPAWGLRSSFQIGTVSRDDRLCPFGGDALVFDTAGRDTARIASIRRISKDEADWLLVRFGKKDPPDEQAPEPKPVEGAEVEELD
ncbi:MAG: DUF6491 family protein [Woeseiaceae bacterium]